MRLNWRNFRKKPEIIQAMQLTNETFMAGHPSGLHIPEVIYDSRMKSARIPTSGGTMTGNLGDWIIKGMKGELYPCKPDIFSATYDEVGVELTEAKHTELPDSAEIMGVRVYVSTGADKENIVVSPEVMQKLMSWAQDVQVAQGNSQKGVAVKSPESL